MQPSSRSVQPDEFQGIEQTTKLLIFRLLFHVRQIQLLTDIIHFYLKIFITEIRFEIITFDLKIIFETIHKDKKLNK